MKHMCWGCYSDIDDDCLVPFLPVKSSLPKRYELEKRVENVIAYLCAACIAAGERANRASKEQSDTASC